MNLDRLEEGMAHWGLPELQETQREQLTLYAELLLEWNARINLTRITEETAIQRQHYLDSIAPMRFLSFAGKSLIDIGTGAGFPGIPLKILNPTLRLTLLDALDKRCRFLREVTERLELADVAVLHGRAEDHAFPPGKGSGAPSLRGSFDYATSRAVAKLNILCEYAVPYLKRGGIFIAYKLDDAGAEGEDAARAMKLLRARIRSREAYELPEVEPRRMLYFISKEDRTPDLYPRKAGTPERKPL